MTTWGQIEAILSDIERLDRESGGKYREPSDRDAYDAICRIERRILQNRGNENAA